MGKTVVVIIIVLLALGCGALGWEVMRQQSGKDELQKKVDNLEGNMNALIAAKSNQPQEKWATEDMVDDLGMRMSSLEKQNKELLASQQELTKQLAELVKSGVAVKSGTGGAPIDIPNMSDEQKEALRDLVKKEGDARDMQRANMIKAMVKQRFSQEMTKAAEELDLTPMQKDDVSKLIDKQIDKGFSALLKAFEKGDFESARQEIRRLMAESEEEVKKILDPDQIEKLDEMMKRNRGQNPFGPGGFQPPTPPRDQNP